MRKLRAFISRLAGLINQRKRDHEFEEEIESHLRLHIEENVRAGMSEDEARRDAVVKLGGIENTKEMHREQRTLIGLENLCRDVRHGARMLRKNPGFTAAAGLTLALCLGANLAILSVVDAILVRTLPFKDPERLAVVFNSYPAAGADRVSGSLPNYFDRRRSIRAFASVSIYQEASVIIGEAGRARRARTMRISPEFFSTLGVSLALGQPFTEENLAYRSDEVAILTDEFWRTEFSGDPGVLGRTFANDGARVTVVGVLPPGFLFLSSRPQFFRPASHAIADRRIQNRHSGDWNMIVRLAPGVSWAEAQGQMDAFNAQQMEDDPIKEKIRSAGYRTIVRSLRDDHVCQIRRILILLQAGVGLLLLIGMVNLTNLLLIRAHSRSQEFAVRQALGATQWQVARGVFAEVMLLACGAGVAGVLIGAGGLRLLSTLGAERLPLGTAIRFDGRMIMAGMAAAIGIGAALAGILVAFNLRMKQEPGLKLKTRSDTGSPRSQSFRYMLVVAQVALAFVLLAGAGLLGMSLKRALEAPVGFNTANILTGRITFPWVGYTNQSLRINFADRVLSTVRTLPGVTGAGVSALLPFADDRSDNAVAVEREETDGDSKIRAHHVADVTSDYWQTLGIPLVRGRYVEEADWRGSRNCVVDQAFAERYWPGADPIGRRIAVSATFSADDALVVVGVVANAKQADVAEPTGLGTVYRPFGRGWPGSFALVVRTSAPLATMGPMLRQAVAQCDPGLPLDNLRSLQSWVDERLVARRSPAVLGGIFAAVALLLASLGVYGVLAHAVSQRRREIGVRVALGAKPGEVLAQFVGLAWKLCVPGLVVGMFGAWAAGRAMQSVLFGVSAFSAPVIFGTALVVGGVVTLASLIPSCRASRMQPMAALRAD
jgi:predicted permease